MKNKNFESGVGGARPDIPDANTAPRKTYNRNAGGGYVQATVNRKARDYIIRKSKEFGISRAEQLRYMLNRYIEIEERDENLMRELMAKKSEVLI